ncbi:hypothetical protein [Georgenia yuyongxinii]
MSEQSPYGPHTAQILKLAELVRTKAIHNLEQTKRGREMLEQYREVERALEEEPQDRADVPKPSPDAPDPR